MRKKFEYKILDIEYNSWTSKPKADIQASLNQLGLEGWELVSATHTHGTAKSFIFKREIIG